MCLIRPMKTAIVADKPRYVSVVSFPALPALFIGERKMRSLFVISAVLLLLPAARANAENSDERIEQLEKRIQALEEERVFRYAIVSEAEVMDNLEEKKEIDVDTELAVKDGEKAIKPLRREMDSLEAELRLLAEGSEAYNEKLADYQAKMEEFTQKYRQLNDDIQQQHARKIDTLRMKIRTHIAQYARDNGYDLVIEKTALLYGQERESITTEIIDRMNAEYFESRYENEE